MEDRCIGIKKHGTVIYAYPFDDKYFHFGCKVITRGGKTVRKLKKQTIENKDCYVGMIGDDRMMWDCAGRYDGAYADSEHDLYIPERYWYTNWRDLLKMNNEDWNRVYGIDHPKATVYHSTPNVNFTTYDGIQYE